MKQHFLKLQFLVTSVFLLLFFAYGCDKREDAHTGGNTTLTQGETTPAVLVEVVRPKIQRIEHRIRALGSFLPEDEVTIAPEIGGKVKRVLVEEGDIVRKGQLLLRLDDKRQLLALAEAEAKIRENEAGLAYEEITLKRREELWRKNVLSEQDYDESVSRVNMTKARADSLKAALEISRKDLEDTRITSPLDGIITEKSVSEGEYVHVGDGLFEAVKINPLKLGFTLPEAHIGWVQQGQWVKAKVKAYPEREFSGKVYFVNPQVDPATRSVRIKAYFDNPEGLLKPGFFADVFLVRDVNEEALLIPGEGLVQREGKALIYVMSDGVARERTVKIGERLEGKVEILSGLKAGDLVVTTGNHDLEDGALIKLRNHQ